MHLQVSLVCFEVNQCKFSCLRLPHMNQHLLHVPFNGQINQVIIGLVRIYLHPMEL